MTSTDLSLANKPIWLLVAQREIRVASRSKLLWVSTIGILLFIVGGIVAAHLLSKTTTTYQVAVMSPAALDVVTLAGKQQAGVEIKTQQLPDATAAKNAVRSGNVDVALLALDSGSGWTIVSNGTVPSDLSASLTAAAQVTAISQNAATLKVPITAITRGAEVRSLVLDPSSRDDPKRYFLSLSFGLLFMLSCQLFGTTIANSVVEEKESRVVEVILAAISTRALLIGKIVGNAVLGIAQMMLFVGAALVAVSAVGGVPELGAIAASSGWFLLGYVIGFSTVCCLFAGLGALASRTQDIPAATAPLQLVVTATYLISLIGTGGLLTVASFVPITSSVTMPARIFAGAVPWWQVALSLLLALAFGGVCIPIAARIYNASIMRTGGRVGLRGAVRRRGGQELNPARAN